MMNLHPGQGRCLGVALICAALAAIPGCKDDDGSYVSSVVDPVPEPEPDPRPDPAPDPDPDTEPTLYRTTDGGATWTTSNLPFGVRSSKLISFDAQNGWLKSGKTLYSTEDGGATWQAKLDAGSEHLDTFEAVSMNQAWAAIRHYDTGASEVLRTSDGGATWTSSAFPQYQFVYNLDFVDASSGWCVADASSVYHTSDGGATWTLQETPEIPGGPWVYHGISRLAFVNSTTGWGVGSVGNTISGQYGFMLKYATGSNPVGTWEVQLSGMNSFKALSAVDPDHAWALNLNGLFRTQDGGATWSNLGIPTDYGGPFRFTDASNGWMIINSNEVRSTSDGGETWTVRLTLPKPPPSALPRSLNPALRVRSLSFVSATTGWLTAEK